MFRGSTVGFSPNLGVRQKCNIKIFAQKFKKIQNFWHFRIENSKGYKIKKKLELKLDPVARKVNLGFLAHFRPQKPKKAFFRPKTQNFDFGPVDKKNAL